MKRKLMIAAGIAVALVAIVIVGITLVEPDYRPAPDLTVSKSRTAVDRGSYLARHVLACVECHSKRDWTTYGGKIMQPAAAGGPCLTGKDGIPGYVCLPNITSDRATGLGRWSDGEIYRAIREGVNDREKALAPLMPYASFRHLSDQDTEAVVAYLRTLPAHENFVPRTFLRFPLNVMVETLPEPLETPVPTPAAGEAYGKYLATVAGCESCHTPVDGLLRIQTDKLYTGGRRFVGPWGDVLSTNLTPDDTGLKKYSREEFIALFKAFAAPGSENIVSEDGKNTNMPWRSFAGMTESDLGAIYDYLLTLPPVAHDVKNPVRTWDVIHQMAREPTVADDEEPTATPAPAATPEDIEAGGDDESDTELSDDY